MKNFKQRILKGAILFAIAVVIVSIVVFVLAATNVIAKNPLQLGFVVFSIGIGLVFTAYGAIMKGGYELAVGLLLILIGVCVSFIGLLKWWVILIIALGFVVLALLTLILVKANKLIIERTDEQADFKPYSQVLEEKKAEDKIKESQPLPELKDYSNKD